MIPMHSKYDNMHNKIVLYALICINIHIITGTCCMLLGAMTASHAQKRKITPNRSNQERKREKTWGMGGGREKRRWRARESESRRWTESVKEREFVGDNKIERER